MSLISALKQDSPSHGGLSVPDALCSHPVGPSGYSGEGRTKEVQTLREGEWVTVQRLRCLPSSVKGLGWGPQFLACTCLHEDSSSASLPPRVPPTLCSLFLVQVQRTPFPGLCLARPFSSGLALAPRDAIFITGLSNAFPSIETHLLHSGCGLGV